MDCDKVAMALPMFGDHDKHVFGHYVIMVHYGRFVGVPEMRTEYLRNKAYMYN
jgi:hypothetical protein